MENKVVENKNSIGLTKQDYAGGISTLCTGCGHDQITNHIITACYQLGIDPYDVVKTSGIGCSSKTPAYFLNKSFGINSLHGRMAPLTTGSKVVHPNLIHIGISGDGDTGAIGLGGFVHLIRRNLPMVYIVANNGVYGLTKGQFSPTSDKGTKLKNGDENIFENIDLCSMALDLGCGFVARSFSGDMKQMVAILKAALKYNGTALIDVISPCVTFNNHDGSTKSFSWMKEHDVVLQELGFVAPQEAIQVDYQEGSVEVVTLHDGTVLTLKKINSQTHSVKDKMSAFSALHEAKKNNQVLTGIYYLNPDSKNLIENLNLDKKSLAYQSELSCRGEKSVFEEIMAELS